MRLRQWIKSAFILAPALFTLDFLHPVVWSKLFLGAVGFSFMASAIYTFNDLMNREEDRLHPIKRMRPIASGALTLRAAKVLCGVCLIIGTVMLGVTGLKPLMIAAGYVGMMVWYTLMLRRVFMLDVLAIAAGYVIRVELGGFIIAEPVSRWLLLCTFTLALFLAMIKRRQEIAALDEQESNSGRDSLSDYPPLYVIDGWINVAAGMALLSYALYTMDAGTIAKHQTESLIFTVPLVIYGIFRYQKLALSGRLGEDPARLVSKDPGMIAVVILWALTTGVILVLAK